MKSPVKVAQNLDYAGGNLASFSTEILGSPKVLGTFIPTTVMHVTKIKCY